MYFLNIRSQMENHVLMRKSRTHDTLSYFPKIAFVEERNEI